MGLTEKQAAILESITIGSYNNPLQPEFPPENPSFPATPTYQISVPGFDNVRIKDESKNPTGTHKDRMGREIVVTYRDILLAYKQRPGKHQLPSMSLISSGSAALAVQTELIRYGLPNLKVLVDHTLPTAIKDSLITIGCEVYTTDLSSKLLLPQDILSLTNNALGIDITSDRALQPTTRFYDRLSYEIINESPQRCFIPFGSGILYENILNIVRAEVNAQHNDPRFHGDKSVIRSCHYIGATTKDPYSQAIKLYSPHLPYSGTSKEWIKVLKKSGVCGTNTSVEIFQEHMLSQAVTLLAEQGVDSEPSGAAGLALLLQKREQIPPKDKILIINTGKTKNPL